MPNLRIFIELLPGVIVRAPILTPAAAELGVDPIHSATIVISNLTPGTIAPPGGRLRSFVCDVAGMPPSVPKPFLPAHGIVPVLPASVPAPSPRAPHAPGIE